MKEVSIELDKFEVQIRKLFLIPPIKPIKIKKSQENKENNKENNNKENNKENKENNKENTNTNTKKDKLKNTKPKLEPKEYKVEISQEFKDFFKIKGENKIFLKDATSSFNKYVKVKDLQIENKIILDKNLKLLFRVPDKVKVVSINNVNKYLNNHYQSI